MLKIIKVIFLILVIFSVSFAQDGFQDNWIAKDKAKHYIGSMIGTILVTKTSERHFSLSSKKSDYIGISFVCSLGIFKEMMDKQKPGNIFSWKDLTADLFGIVSAILILDIK